MWRSRVSSDFFSGRYGEVALEIAEGNIVAVIGKNGIGKSRLIRCFAGLEGELHIQSSTPLVLNQHNRAYLPQNHSLAFAIHVEELLNLAFVNQCSRQEFNRWLDRIVEQLSLKDLLHKPYTELSGGEKQRSQLARVLCQLAGGLKDKLLLLDEPFAALDIDHQAALVKTLKQFANEGLRIVVALHEIHLLGVFPTHALLLARRQYEFSSIDTIAESHFSELYGVPVERTQYDGKLDFRVRF